LTTSWNRQGNIIFVRTLTVSCVCWCFIRYILQQTTTLRLSTGLLMF